jgi:superfamily II DNA helicase RecQ
MQVNLFHIGVGDCVAQEEMNRFLRGHRVLTLDRQWTGYGWSFCVTWQETKNESRESGSREVSSRVDYKEVLDAATFALFSDLRAARKSLAEKESLPAYAVFTNEQLAEISRMRCATATELGKIEGVGKARVDKYGTAVLTVIAEHHAKQQTEIGTSGGS